MAHRRARLVVGLLPAVAILLACGTPPQKEMEEARAAVASARAAGAGQYAPDDLAAAADALTRSEAAVAQRDFRLALNEALDARARAEDAANVAAAKEATVRTEAQRAVADVAAIADRLRDAVAAAESARPPRQARKAVSDARRTIVVANVALQKAREALGRKDYVHARSALDGVRDQLNGALAALAKPLAPPALDPPR